MNDFSINLQNCHRFVLRFVLVDLILSLFGLIAYFLVLGSIGPHLVPPWLSDFDPGGGF